MESTARDREWLRVRRYLRDHRFELGVAAGEHLYPGTGRVAGTPLLTIPRWTPAHPVPMDTVALEHEPVAVEQPEPRYSATMSRLARPAVFDNRPTYRLLDAVLDGDRPRMRFGDGHYFDGIDTGVAVAHEYAAAHLARTNGTFEQAHCSKVPFVAQGVGVLPRRDALGDPVDPARRPVNVAISAVTIRAGDAPRFLAHRRDPASVAHAGGLLQVVPAGIFQPVSEETAEHDFDLWRCLQRELAEELLGRDEATGRVDYDERDPGIRPSVLGMGVDPLTLATDLLCAVVVDAATFDRTFSGLVSANAEGELSSHPFTARVVDRFVRTERMQAAGAAVLALAWRHRERLLS